jgi:hypothetical protein
MDLVGWQHFLSNPPIPALEELCAWPMRVRSPRPSHVNHCEWHLAALDFERHVISVDTASDCFYIESVKRVFWRNFLLQLSSKEFSPVPQDE